MITKLLTALAIGIVVFEIIEHLVFPLIWAIVTRKRRSPCGVEDMIGKEVEVKSWGETEGKVLVNGELWNAESNRPLLRGDKALIESVEGLKLKVKPLEKN